MDAGWPGMQGNKVISEIGIIMPQQHESGGGGGGDTFQFPPVHHPAHPHHPAHHGSHHRDDDEHGITL